MTNTLTMIYYHLTNSDPKNANALFLKNSNEYDNNEIFKYLHLLMVYNYSEELAEAIHLGNKLANNEKTSLLFYAMQQQNNHFFHLIISQLNPNLDFSIKKNNTDDILILGEAFSHGTIEMIDSFVKKGHDAYYGDEYLFGLACLKNNINTIEQIYEKYNFDINKINTVNHLTPLNLLLSAETSNLCKEILMDDIINYPIGKKIQFLLDNGAIINQKTLDLLIKNNDHDVFSLFFEYLSTEQLEYCISTISKKTHPVYGNLKSHTLSSLNACLMKNKLDHDLTQLHTPLKKSKL